MICWKKGLVACFKASVVLIYLNANRLCPLQPNPSSSCDICLDLNERKSDCETTLIPMNMIDVVDAGVNPNQIQKQQIQTLVDKNQKLNGRLKSLKVSSFSLD